MDVNGGDELDYSSTIRKKVIRLGKSTHSNKVHKGLLTIKET